MSYLLWKRMPLDNQSGTQTAEGRNDVPSMHGPHRVHSDGQRITTGKQLGNTMSVNVLERIFARVLPAAGLAKPGALVDESWLGHAPHHNSRNDT